MALAIDDRSTSLAPDATRGRRALSVLIVSTLAFTVCFMVWMMFGVIGIPIRQALNLSATEFGLLTAMPVLTGSLVRVPLGIWTDRVGGRIVMTLLMASTVPAIYLMAYATAYWHFLVIGLFVGLAGGLAGGLGGFVLPILFVLLMDATGIRTRLPTRCQRGSALAASTAATDTSAARRPPALRAPSRHRTSRSTCPGSS